MEVVMAVVAVAVAYAIEMSLLVLLSRDAARHNIQLSRTARILFLLSFTAPFVLVWYLIKRRGVRGVQTEPERTLSANRTSPTQSLSDPTILVQSPEELLSSLDARTRAHFKKDPVFKRIVATYEGLPIGGKERAREIKKLVDYFQEQIVNLR
jgi:hypothetical protein